MKSSNTLAKKPHKSSKVKQSLSKVLTLAQASPQTKSTVIKQHNHQKTTKIKPHLNKVFALRHT
jgi:hypothetical protein